MERTFYWVGNIPLGTGEKALTKGMPLKAEHLKDKRFERWLKKGLVSKDIAVLKELPDIKKVGDDNIKLQEEISKLLEENSIISKELFEYKEMSEKLEFQLLEANETINKYIIRLTEHLSIASTAIDALNQETLKKSDKANVIEILSKIVDNLPEDKTNPEPNPEPVEG